MISTAAGLLLLQILLPTPGPRTFDHPWRDSATALVLDPYQDNRLDWNALASEPRVVAIIHRATVGTSRVDTAYFSRRLEARARGYLWDSYHLGPRGHPVEQADFYLDTVAPDSTELIALDLEDVESSRFMSAVEADSFVTRVWQRLGRYPVVYANHQVATTIARRPLFARTPLWYARFRGRISNFPTPTWPTYALWQFSSEILCQLRVPGTLPDMDINVFDGPADSLRMAWPFTAR